MEHQKDPAQLLEGVAPPSVRRENDPVVQVVEAKMQTVKRDLFDPYACISESNVICICALI